MADATSGAARIGVLYGLRLDTPASSGADQES